MYQWRLRLCGFEESGIIESGLRNRLAREHFALLRVFAVRRGLRLEATPSSGCRVFLPLVIKND
jgi:hypothetical protein